MYLVMDSQNEEFRLLLDDESIEHREDCQCEEHAELFVAMFLTEAVLDNILNLN